MHFVDVKLNDHHVPDSPFAVMVGSTAADPAMVHAHGPGLEHGSCSMYTLVMLYQGLQNRVHNQSIILLFLNQNICCRYSNEPSQ